MSMMRAIRFRRKEIKTAPETVEQRVQTATDIDAATHLEQHKTTAARLIDTMRHQHDVHLAQLSALYNALSGVEHYSKEVVADGVIVYGNIKLTRKNGVVSLTDSQE